jgi:hypothetical protein
MSEREYTLQEIRDVLHASGRWIFDDEALKEIAQGLDLKLKLPVRLAFRSGRIVNAVNHELVSGETRAEAARCYNAVAEALEYAERANGSSIPHSTRLHAILAILREGGK